MRMLITFLIFVFTSPALAGTTWTTPKNNVSKLVCTTDTESAPTLVSEGLALSRVNKKPLVTIEVHIETAGTLTVNTVVLAYLWNPISAQWNRASDLDLTIKAAAAASEAFASFVVTRSYTGSRIAYVPNGIGAAPTIYIIGSK